ncbi:flippase [Methanobacterium sp. MBAC-LM]|uniref:flippase n=1 Tax=Methanobacterium sp. MBAC-LM TaxID=3412034 RepID=UPI003C725825
MSKSRTIAKNTAVLFTATIISYILIFFVNIYIARYLGAEGFGILSLAIALTGIFTIFTDLGLNTLTIREVTRDKSSTNDYLINTFLIKVFLAFLTLILIFVAVNAIGYTKEVSYVIYIITLSVIITAFTNVFNSIFQAYEQMEYMSIGNILNSVVLFTGIITGIFYKLDIFFFAAVYLVASLTVLIYSVGVYIWKFHVPEINVNLNFWKSTLKEALPFGVTNIFGSIYYWIDSVMLSKMVGNEVVGWYNAAYRLMFVFLSIYTVYLTAIFPVMSKFYKTSDEYLKFSYERSYKYLLIISLPIAFGTTVLADKIILLIYGNGYIPAILALQILIWTVPLLSINGLTGYVVGAINRQMILTKITFIGAVLNIILNLVLIPKFSFIGSSIATVVTELILLPLLIYPLVKEGYATKKPLSKDFPKLILSNLVMMTLIIVLRDFNLLLLILLASFVYFVTIYLFRVLDEIDISLIRRLLNYG